MSLLDRNVRTLSEAGVGDQLVVTGYMANRIEALGLETVYNSAYDETEMVHSLFCAADQFPTSRDLIISYGDITYKQPIVEQLLACQKPLCVVVDRAWQQLWHQRFNDPRDDAETLRVNKDDQIKEIGGEPEKITEIEGQYIGLFKIRNDYINESKRIYRNLPIEGSEAVEMTHFIQYLIFSGWIVEAILIEGGWLEVDTLSDLELYQDLVDNQTEHPHTDWIWN
jgi:choline kinase